MNRVFLIGRLTKEPELRYSHSGLAVCQFVLAVDRGFSKEKKQEYKQANRATADFIRVVVWDKQAEYASKYLVKGFQCAVEGSIQTGSYQDRSGKTIYTMDVVASHIEFLSNLSRKGGKETTNNKNGTRVYREGVQSNVGRSGANLGHDDFGDDFYDEWESELPF